ncbi:hypothetical protein [Salinibaculum rarum]|uniref:hypothetical protein n=1 Tax=Salinibaculum rarum TaxID=3058903 RepID=UPI00265F69E1|nr:hypothetical protein [Salinibaculum sp. KK48]
MNLHFELGGLDWSGTGARALEPNLDMFPSDTHEAYTDLYAKAVESLPALLENAYAALWVHVARHDLLVYSVADAGHRFPVDQANAGVDVVLLNSNEIVAHDQAVSIETAAEALFDFTMYASRKELAPRESSLSSDSLGAVNGDPLSVTITDRTLIAPHISVEPESLVTDEGRKARWVIDQPERPDFPHRDLLVLPGPYWHPRDDQYTEDVTDAEKRRVVEALCTHAGDDSSRTNIRVASQTNAD